MEQRVAKILSALEDFNIDIVFDESKNIIYCSSSFLDDLMGFRDGTWFSLDLKKLLSDAGYDFTDILEMSGKDFEMAEYLNALMDKVNVNDSVSAAATAEIVTVCKKRTALRFGV